MSWEESEGVNCDSTLAHLEYWHCYATNGMIITLLQSHTSSTSRALSFNLCNVALLRPSLSSKGRWNTPRHRLQTRLLQQSYGLPSTVLQKLQYVHFYLLPLSLALNTAMNQFQNTPHPLQSWKSLVPPYLTELLFPHFSPSICGHPFSHPHYQVRVPHCWWLSFVSLV